MIERRTERVLLAHRIHAASHLTGEFQLRSGLTATEYFDKYRFEAEPALLRTIAEHMAPLVPPGIDALAGLEMGGIPIVTMLSQVTGLPSLFVRKRAKEYGTCRFAEGGEVEGRTLLIVEDIVTTGGQIALSSADLRGLGAHIETALCVVDREQGGAEKLAAAGIALRSLFVRAELVQAPIES